MYKCPGCEGSLSTSSLGIVEIETCCDCGGMWLDANELEIVVEKAQSMLKNREFPVVNDVEAPSEKSIDRKCPKCIDTSLTAFVYAFDSGIELDKCPLCKGLWLDKGEFELLSTQAFDIDYSESRAFTSTKTCGHRIQKQERSFIESLGILLLRILILR